MTRWEYRRHDTGWLHEDGDNLDDHLDVGWEPFAVTKGLGRGTADVIHLRRPREEVPS